VGNLVHFVGVKTKSAEFLRRKLKERNLLLTGFAAFQKNGKIYFPIKNSEEVRKLLETLNLNGDIIESEISQKKKKRGKLYELIADKIPETLIKYIPRSFDVIGDICIVEMNEEIWPYREIIGRTIVEQFKNIKSVYAKGGKVSGDIRVRPLIHVYGEKKTLTIHRENNCIFYVDVEKVYFSPRLATEHMRVAKQVKDGEIIVDMFAGVGPFSILIAKMANAKIYAIDKNPSAIELLKRNIQINKLKGTVIPILGDARDVIRKQLEKNVADRVIMNLPLSADKFLDVAFYALKNEGIIHFYTVKRENEPYDRIFDFLKSKAEEEGYKLERVLTCRKVKEIAPHEFQIVVDCFFKLK